MLILPIFQGKFSLVIGFLNVIYMILDTSFRYYDLVLFDILILA